MKKYITYLAVILFASISGGALAHADTNCPTYFPYGYGYYGSSASYNSYSCGATSNFQGGGSSGYYFGTGPVSGQTLPATGIANASAVLNGVVVSNGQGAQYQFEYGTTPAFGYSTPLTSLLAGQATANVSYQISSLIPATTYFYRLEAQNYAGSGTPGQILSFTTGASYASATNVNYQIGTQTAKTDVAYPVGTRSATLAGIVNPHGLSTSYHFEYDTTPDLDHSTVSREAGNGTSDFLVSCDLSGLAAGTTYYYRVAAESDRGVVVGTTMSFTTRSGSSGGVTARSTDATTAATSNAANSTPTSGNAPAVTDAYTATNSYGMGAQLLAAFGARPAPCFVLSGQLSAKTAAPGATLSYTLSGKNSCSTDFAGTVVRITIPDATQLASSTSPYTAVDGNTYSYTLGNFPRGSKLSLTVTGITKEDAAVGTPLVFTGTVDFNDGGTYQRIGTTSTGEVSISFLASIANLFRSKNTPASPAEVQTSNLAESQTGNSLFLNIFLALVVVALIIWFAFREKKIPARTARIVASR